MRARVAALWAALGAVACGPARPTVAPRVVRAPLAAPKVVPGELDSLAVLGDAPAKAMKAGAGPLSIVASGVATDGERIGAFLEIPTDACVVGYARGAHTLEDLDVAAFSEEGAPIVVDETPDENPAVLVCPPHPERVYLAAHVARGEGLVTLAAQLVPRERAVEVGRALGARGGAFDGPRPIESWPGIDDLVRPHRASLGGRWDEFRKVTVTVDPRVPTYLGFTVEADQCVDAVVIPDDEVGNLEVEATDTEGRVLGRAHEGGRVRTVTLCSPMTVAAALAIRPHAGRGRAAVVLARARAEVARDLTDRGEVAWTAATQPLDAARAKRNQELSKAGYAAPRVAGSGQLVIGRRSSVPIELRQPAGACERLDVVAGAPLALVEGAVWDDAGALVATAQGVESVTLFACARGKARVDLDARGRPGPFMLLARQERWQSPAFAAHPLAAARMLARSADGPRMLLDGTAGAARAVALDAAHAVTWDVTVPAGRCLRVAAGVEGEGSGVLLRLFDAATQEELDRSHAPHAAAVRACATTAPRGLRAELRATAGKLAAVVGERTTP